MKAFVRGQAAGGPLRALRARVAAGHGAGRQATGDPLPPTTSPTGASPPRAPHVRGRLPPSSVAVALIAGIAIVFPLVYGGQSYLMSVATLILI